jgi:hypothetical protein
VAGPPAGARLRTGAGGPASLATALVAKLSV